MKKKISALLLGALLLSGGSLSSCGEDIPFSSSSTEPVVEVTELPARMQDIISTYFTGKIGDAKNNLEIKAEYKATKFTVTGTYACAGDGNYYGPGKGLNGYLVTDHGYTMYLHSSKDTSDKVLTDVTTGTKITVTGLLAGHNGLPQITSYDYEVVEAAPTGDALKTKVSELFHEVTSEELTKIANSSQITDDYDWALRPIVLKNMVNVSDVIGSDKSYWVPLQYIGAENEAKYQIAVYRPSGIAGPINKGGLYDLYGAVTAYYGAPQLNLANSSSTSTLKGLNEVSTSKLTNEEKLAIAKVRTDLSEIKGTLSFYENAKEEDYAELDGAFASTTLGNPDLDGVTVSYVIKEAETSWFEIGTNSVSGKTSFQLKGYDGTNKPDSVKVSALRTFLGTEWKKDYTVTIIRTLTVTGVEPVVEEIPCTYTVKSIALNKAINYNVSTSLPQYVNYITNDPSKPEPQFNPITGGGEKGLYLYTNGGIHTDPLEEGHELKKSDIKSIKIRVGFRKYKTHSGEMVVTLRDAEGTELGTAKITCTTEEAGAFKDYTITDITWNNEVTDDTLISSIKVMNTGSLRAYLSTVEVSKDSATTGGPGEGSGEGSSSSSESSTTDPSTGSGGDSSSSSESSTTDETTGA